MLSSRARELPSGYQLLNLKHDRRLTPRAPIGDTWQSSSALLLSGAKCTSCPTTTENNSQGSTSTTRNIIGDKQPEPPASAARENQSALLRSRSEVHVPRQRRSQVEPYSRPPEQHPSKTAPTGPRAQHSQPSAPLETVSQDPFRTESAHPGLLDTPRSMEDQPVSREVELHIVDEEMRDELQPSGSFLSQPPQEDCSRVTMNIKDVQQLHKVVDSSLHLLGKISKENKSTHDYLMKRGISTDITISAPGSLQGSELDLLDSQSENEFSQPAKKYKKRTRKEAAPSQPLPTRNRFTPLDLQQLQPPAPPPTRSRPQPPQPEEKCPPIVLHEAAKWNAVRARLHETRINYTKARATSSGINVYPSSIADFRATITLFDAMKVQYHFYKLRSEKPLKVVIRGLPIDTDLSDIEEDLKIKGYKDFTLSRFPSRDGRQSPLVLVEIPRVFKNLYNETTICSLVVVMESQHRKASSGQCHRCQRYGHAQSGCRANYRCLKCAESHSTHLCPKPKSLPAKCANCAGEHPANFRGCPENPRGKDPQPQPQVPIQQAWKVPHTYDPPQPVPHVDPHNFPALPRSSPAQLPHSDRRPPTQASRKEEIAKEIGTIIMQFSQLRPTSEQLSSLIATVTRLARLAS